MRQCSAHDPLLNARGSTDHPFLCMKIYLNSIFQRSREVCSEED